MIPAVVFDLDGVIVDSEQLWDEVREQLVADWGGRYSEAAQRAMMGMSSSEWSRYMHDELGLPQSPEEINEEVVRRMLARYRARAAADRRGGRRRPRPRALVPARGRVLLEPAADRGRARGRRNLGLLRRHGVVGGGAARQAEPRRLPRGRSTARRPRRGLRGRGGLGERDPRCERGAGCGWSRIPNRHYPPDEEALRLAGAVVASPADDPGCHPRRHPATG